MVQLADLPATFASLAERCGGAVVAVGHGNGVVVASGRVLTNAHNLHGEQPAVTFPDGRRASATIRGANVDADLAVLAVDTGDVTPLGWPEGEVDLVPGRAVFALSNPRGRGPRVTFGLVAAVGQRFRGPGGRSIHDAVEHTAPLPRGSSGGPLVDADGTLLGLNTHRRGEGFYLARPASPELRSRVDSLDAGEAVTRPRLGIAVAPPELARRLRRAVGLDERSGLLVRNVDEDGPADRAGLQRGDLIVTVDGDPLRTSDDLFAALDTVATGGELTLGVVRGAEERTVTVTFPPEPDGGGAS